MLRVHHVDVGNRIRVDHRTPQGGARVPAALARTGVQLYPQADGTVRREYRPPEEVFDAKSLATFETATLVVGHPAQINPANWKEHAVGDIRGAKRDGRYVASDLLVRDKATLDKIDSGELQEISCGYDCMLEMTPGRTEDGEEYDAIQRQITINHVGLGPAGWGRAGSQVRLRLDGVEVAYLEERSDRTTPAGMNEEQLKALLAAIGKIDGLVAKVDALETKVSSGGAQPPAKVEPPARADAGEVARLQAQLDEANDKAKRLQEASSPERTDALVRARVALLDGARVLHGKDVPTRNADGKQFTDREIMVSAILARDSTFQAEGKNDEYVRARFDVKVEDAKRAGESLAGLNEFSSPARLDGATPGNGGIDRELEALCKRFDAGAQYLENYTHADAWLVGETAARDAADAALAKQIGA